jgi:hypothetical protein
MASRKPLVLNGGAIEQLQSGDTLDAATTGKDVVNLTASAALAVGDAVYISAAGTVAKAQANAVATARVIGFAAESIGASASGPIQTDGILPGMTGLTAGATYYLSDATPGLVSSTPPSGAGKYVVCVGTAISETELEISIREPIKL